MSQERAIESPAPAAAPRTAAMAGFDASCSRREISIRSRSDCARSSMVPVTSRLRAIAFTSPPAENARPAPVTTMQADRGVARQARHRLEQAVHHLPRQRVQAVGPVHGQGRDGRSRIARAGHSSCSSVTSGPRHLRMDSSRSRTGTARSSGARTFPVPRVSSRAPADGRGSSPERAIALFPCAHRAQCPFAPLSHPLGNPMRLAG